MCNVQYIVYHRVASGHNSIVFVLWVSVPTALVHFLKMLWMCSPAVGLSFGLLGLTVSVVGGRCPMFLLQCPTVFAPQTGTRRFIFWTLQQPCYCASLVRGFDLCNACCHLSHTWGGKCKRFASQGWRCAACACSFITFSLRASVCAMFSQTSAQRGSRTPKKAQVVCFI